MVYLRRVIACGLLGITIVLSVATTVRAFDTSHFRPHVTVNLGSKHINASRDFNEVNPGFGIGVSAPVADGKYEMAVELGQYRNSVNGNSTYVVGSLDTEAAALSRRTKVRLGGFAGVVRYPGLSDKFTSGIPSVGDWVAAGGVQATVRVDDTYDFPASRPARRQRGRTPSLHSNSGSVTDLAYLR